MIEDLIKLGTDYDDDDLWWAYFELCQENSKFAGLTKIRSRMFIGEFIYCIDILDVTNNFNIIYSLQIYWICGAYEIKVYKCLSEVPLDYDYRLPLDYSFNYNFIRKEMLPKERIKSTILSYFNWITT